MTDFSQPITFLQLIIANLVATLPMIFLIARGIWYLSRMTHKVDQMWAVFKREHFHLGAAQGDDTDAI